MNKVKEKLMEALEKGEFRQFLEGTKDYRIEVWGYESIAPHDTTRMLRAGIYEVFETHPELNIDKKLMEELVNMMCGGGEYSVYMAYEIVYDHMSNEARGSAPFKINKDLIGQLEESLEKNKPNLMGYKMWVGYGQENGVWDWIMQKKSTFDENVRRAMEL